MHGNDSWPLVGAVDSTGLVEARLQAHHAAQLVVSLGISLLPRKEDDSHTNLEWIAPLGVLAGRVVPGSPDFRGALRVADLTLLMLDGAGVSWAELPLSGQTMAQGYVWLGDRLVEAGASAGKLTPEKHYTILQHPVSDGAVFRLDAGELFRELARYYAGADQVLRQLAADHPSASEVRCWPHHFDLATLITVDRGRTAGAGLSPGDESYPEPYFYVTPYPYPKEPLPDLAVGFRHTTGWIGAVLPGSRIVRLTNAERQRAEVEQFLQVAVSASRKALAGR